MAVLAIVFTGAILVFCIVIFAQRVGPGIGQRRRVHTRDGGGDFAWSAAVGDSGDSGSDCSGADAGGACDGGGGGGGGD